MSTSTLAYESRKAQGLALVRDYVDLTRPRIGAMVLVTVTVGAVLGTWGLPSPMLLLHTLLGTALVASSAGALNQWLERGTDSRMARTARRPLPAGRMQAIEALGFGFVSAAAGLAWLAVAVNARTALLGLATWVLYVWVYTPLKSRTSANTAVGAVAGALPALMGWAAVGGRFDLSAATLFLIVYLWQFPHFMAIAWIYRDQYGQAGLRMLSVVDTSGRRAGRQAVMAAAALLAVSLVPAWQLVGPDRAVVYLLGAAALGLAQLALALSFRRRLDDASARRLLRASLVYLPGVLSLLMLARLI